MIFESALDVFGSRCRRFWRFLEEEGGAALNAFKPASRRVRKVKSSHMHVPNKTPNPNSNSTLNPNPQCTQLHPHSSPQQAHHSTSLLSRGQIKPSSVCNAEKPHADTPKPPSLTFINMNLEPALEPTRTHKSEGHGRFLFLLREHGELLAHYAWCCGGGWLTAAM